MSRRYAFAAFLLWLAAIYVAMVMSAPTAIRAILAAPILYAPGRLALGCLGIRQTPLDRLFSSLVLSIAILILCGLTLHMIDALTTNGWLAGIGVVVLSLCLLDGARDIAAPRLSAFIRPLAVAQILVAAVLGVAAFRTTFQDARADRPFDVLELWLVADPAAGGLRLGIHNGDKEPRRVLFEVRGQGRIIEGRRAVTVAGNATFQQTIDVAADPEKPEGVTAVLYTSSDTIARRVRVVVGAKPSISPGAH
ncbi:MAG: hypothetical protein KDJ16_18430 [Hyphomicrobiales bacterium]|nr:hypothetical protein [Hyphomicrobiales bacterium]